MKKKRVVFLGLGVAMMACGMFFGIWGLVILPILLVGGVAFNQSFKIMEWTEHEYKRRGVFFSVLCALICMWPVCFLASSPNPFFIIAVAVDAAMWMLHFVLQKLRVRKTFQEQMFWFNLLELFADAAMAFVINWVILRLYMDAVRVQIVVQGVAGAMALISARYFIDHVIWLCPVDQGRLNRLQEENQEYYRVIVETTNHWSALRFMFPIAVMLMISHLIASH